MLVHWNIMKRNSRSVLILMGSFWSKAQTNDIKRLKKATQDSSDVSSSHELNLNHRLVPMHHFVPPGTSEVLCTIITTIYALE